MTTKTGKMNGVEAKFELSSKPEQYTAITVKLSAMGQTQNLTFIIQSKNVAHQLSRQEVEEAIENMTFEQVVKAVQATIFEI